MAEAKKLWSLVLKGKRNQVVEFIASCSCNVDVQDRNGRTPLHIAAIRKDPAIASALIGKGANVNHVDKVGVTSLHIAAGLGCLPIVESLIDAKANPFLDVNGVNALHYASSVSLADVSKMVKVPNDKKRFDLKGRKQCAMALVAVMKTLGQQFSAAPGFTSMPRVENKSDNKTRNSYGEVSGTTFTVRASNYSNLKKKKPSAECFYDIHNVDIYKSAYKAKNVASYLKFPKLEHHADMKGLENVPKFLVFQLMVPNYAPSNPMWGDNVVDGESIQYMLTFQLSPYGMEQLREGKTGAARLAMQMFNADPAGDAALRAQLKCIPRLVNPTALGLGSMALRTVSSYNQKPFLTGPRCHTWYKTPDYLEIDVDVHTFQYLARKGLNSYIKHCDQAVCDFGIVFEQRDDHPEQMLGACRTFPYDVKSLKTWGSYLSSFHAAAATEKIDQ